MAQERAGGSDVVAVGSETENYLRYLQLDGAVPLYPWSERAFSPQELDYLLASKSLHPWAKQFRRFDIVRRRRFRWLSPVASIRFNSAFPYGRNDGPLWVGRGLTGSAEFGLSARWGPLSLTLAPFAFAAANQGFAMAPNGASGRLSYGDFLQPNQVDVPRRFGSGAYSRLDPGESTLRADWWLFTAGISTANQAWGPASEFPFILGNNAPGFLHVFLGSSRPWNLLVGHLHARVVYGRLDQSPYSSVTGPIAYRDAFVPGTRRFAAGLVASFQPRGIDGLELGAARFYHLPWRIGGPIGSDFRRPFEFLLKDQLHSSNSTTDARIGDENQLASIFARWVLPHSGAEVYAEYGREDHSWDRRDLVLQPDHSAGYSLGFRKIWRPDSVRMLGLRAETFAFPSSLLLEHRGEGYLYLHLTLRQGHTNDGQILGAGLEPGSPAASLVAFDMYDQRGRWTAQWSRERLADQGTYWQNTNAAPGISDVRHAIGVERLLVRSTYDLTIGASAIYEFNREFRADAFDLNAVATVRFKLW